MGSKNGKTRFQRCMTTWTWFGDLQWIEEDVIERYCPIMQACDRSASEGESGW
jgi:hypothetical protein